MKFSEYTAVSAEEVRRAYSALSRSQRFEAKYIMQERDNTARRIGGHCISQAERASQEDDGIVEGPLHMPF